MLPFVHARPDVNWRPEAPPELTGITDIVLNFETTGLKWFESDRPIAASICLPGGRTQYIPWGHQGGGNLDEATCKRWAERELRGKHITNINTRFDIHQGRVWGVDLEAQGNTVSDVGHYAALLDDHRFKTNLDALITEFLGGVKVARLDESRMVEYHAGEAAPRSEYNVLAVRQLRDLMWPMMTEQGLHKVRALEDQVIYPVCEMEKNGVRLDMERLNRWVIESEQEYLRALWKIHRETGLKVVPTSDKDLEKLFNQLKLPIIRTEKGNPSFTAPILKALQHPIIDIVRRARKVSSMRSKYLVAYQNRVDSKGVLRYGLHQLRAVKGEGDSEGDVGTISGRFSSTEIVRGCGVNIQQVAKVTKQRTSFGFDEDDDSHDDEIYIIRRLMLPDEGSQWLAADAMQIEYRLFAHEGASPKVIEAYRQNPQMSFHKFMHGVIREFQPSFTYGQQKDLNFAKIYAAGLIKMAIMLKFITAEDGERLRKEKASRNHPMLAKALEIDRIYNRECPEVAPLLEKASSLAKHRGYIKTLTGRRMRFPEGYRLHKALNGRIQGSAADINKQKLVELHNARKTTGFKMRFTVHDEVDGDTPGPECTRMVDEILNRQSFPLRVPILWETSVGPNWGQTEKL